jgi:sulfate permease, SulP family
MSGVTVGLIALPLALALGIASIPPGTETPFPAPALGIFTAIFAGFLISALGGSRVQIGGPTAAFIPIILLIVDKHGYWGLILATMMAGVILIVMGITRMGVLIKYIPWPVTSGFTTGIAVSIMATQAGDVLGIRADTPAPREFLERVLWLFEHIGSTHLWTLGIAVSCMLLIRFWPRLGFHRVPGSIVAMVLATLVVAFAGLQDSVGVATVGSKFGANAIPSGLPPFQFPEITLALLRDLLGPATAIAILGAIESLLSAVVADGLSGDRHDSNTELIAQGVANLVCPMFGGLPATGAIARTSANVANGARSPVSGIVHSMTLLAIILLFARYATFVPMAAMAAVLIMVALRMGEWHELGRLNKLTKSDAAVMLTTFGLTVIFDLVIAIEVGMVLAAILFIRRVSDSTEVSRVTSDDVLETHAQLAEGKEIPEGVMVYRIFGPFLFGAAEKMQDALERIGEFPKVLVLRLHLVTAMDSTALHALQSVVERARRAGSTIVISGIHRQPLDLLRKSGFIDIIGRPNFCGSFDTALARSRELLEESAVSAPKNPGAG